MKFRLCWLNEKKEKKTKRFRSTEDIVSVMSNCIYEGEWVETSKGEKVELEWDEFCYENLSFF